MSLSLSSSRSSRLGHPVYGLGSSYASILGNLGKERLKCPEDFLFVKPKVIVEEIEQLFFHQVYLGNVKEHGITGPVDILGRRIIEILGGDDQSGKKHSMAGTRHS